MPTKFYAIATTIVVYCVVLVAFHQHKGLVMARNERASSYAASNSWNPSVLVTGILAALDDEDPVAEQIVPAMLTPVVVPSVVAATGPADPVITEAIQEFNEEISGSDARDLANLIEGTAYEYGVDPYLVAALVSQESAFRQDAVSSVGALGLGQLMPETAADLGVNPHHARENLDGCVRYLAQNLDTWAHTADPVALALASCNAGPGAVEQYGGVPPYEETQNYVNVIKHRYAELRYSRESMG